jgi:hypothetical protein
MNVRAAHQLIASCYRGARLSPFGLALTLDCGASYSVPHHFTALASARARIISRLASFPGLSRRASGPFRLTPLTFK